MTTASYNVLFLCTGNSARSILAEALLARLGHGRFHAYSAGSDPKGQVHPLALETLREQGHETSGLRSKSWDEFAAPEAPVIDFVFTVCGNAAGEVCPVWPGHPITAHWGVDDPADFSGPKEKHRQLFTRTYRELERRISEFIALPLHRTERSDLKTHLDEIGNNDTRAREDD